MNSSDWILSGSKFYFYLFIYFDIFPLPILELAERVGWSKSPKGRSLKSPFACFSLPQGGCVGSGALSSWKRSVCLFAAAEVSAGPHVDGCTGVRMHWSMLCLVGQVRYSEGV